jgi:hypothetical protein
MTVAVTVPEKLDWIRYEKDPQYRADVLDAVQQTVEGRIFLARVIMKADELSPFDSIILKAKLAMLGEEGVTPAVKGVGSLFSKLGKAIGSTGAKFTPWVTHAVSPALKNSWKYLNTVSPGKMIFIGASAFFATDFAISTVKGNKSEMEKLYQTGRGLVGTTVNTTRTMLSMLPLAIVAFGVYTFMRASK